MDIKLDGVVNFLKLPSYILGALAIASGLLLFLPTRAIQLLYMNGFREKYGFTIGIVFIVSLSILLVLLIKRIYNVINKRHSMKKMKVSQEMFLKKLSDDKASLIIDFLQNPSRTLPLPMNDGLVIELQDSGVITPAGQTHFISVIDPRIKYFLQPWVEERIKANEELMRKYHI
jgi:hypothetical protein